MSFPERFKILNDFQFGFRKKRGTKLSLFDLTTEIMKHNDTGYISDFFIDFIQAVDT